MREIQEEWTYDDVMRASAILDFYSAIDTAREAYDKAEFKREQKEIESKANKIGKRR